MADLVNGAFELLGGAFIWMSIFRLYADKLVRGICWPHVAFFTAWGYWNCYYYPSLEQWASFLGGVMIVASNTIWLAQVGYYLWLEKRNAPALGR